MEACELVLHFGRPVVRLEGRDSEDVAALAWHLFEALKTKFSCAMMSDPGQAVLLVDSCDGTPLLTRKRLTSKTQLLDIVRSQRSAGEWLIQRTFLLTESGARAVLFSQPRKMKTKTAWAHFQATRELGMVGRECGLTGLVVQHTVLDRAIQSSLSRHMEELHNLILGQTTQHMSEGQAWLQEQLTWVTSSGCTMHDFHNGYKRGMAAYLNDKAFMAGLYGGVESLRDSMSSITSGVSSWLPTVVRFVDWDMPKDEQYRFYNMFALTPPCRGVSVVLAVAIRWQSPVPCEQDAALSRECTACNHRFAVSVAVSRVDRFEVDLHGQNEQDNDSCNGDRFGQLH